MSTSISRPIVLVVEDDRAIRELFRSTLQEAGLAVIAVEDGLDALRFLEARTPDAVVLDMALPRVSGRDVYRELRAKPQTQRVPIVAVSGHDMDDLNPSDFADVLRKPLSPDLLVRAVWRSVRQHRQSADTL